MFIKESFKVQDRPVTDYIKFTDRVSDFTLQLNFKKSYLLSLGIGSKKNIHNDLKRPFKKILSFRCPLLKQKRELLHDSLPDAVLFRLGCPRQRRKRKGGNKAPLLCWVTFDNLQRSRASSLNRISR